MSPSRSTTWGITEPGRHQTLRPCKGDWPRTTLNFPGIINKHQRSYVGVRARILCCSSTSQIVFLCESSFFHTFYKCLSFAQEYFNGSHSTVLRDPLLDALTRNVQLEGVVWYIPWPSLLAQYWVRQSEHSSPSNTRLYHNQHHYVGNWAVVDRRSQESWDIWNLECKWNAYKRKSAAV
jgi:hypothetical protein